MSDPYINIPRDPALGGNYALGYSNPPLLLSQLGITDPHPTELQPFGEAVPTGANKARWLGLPVCKWTFGFLDHWQMNKLLAFVTSGSQNVYMRTRVNSGTLGGDGLARTPDYVIFQAVMGYPTKMTFRPGAGWADVEIVFTNLINAPPV